MRSNVAAVGPRPRTHEGAPATQLTPLKELRRSVLSALLFEQTFYESGSTHAERVSTLVQRVKPEDVAALAVEARERMHLRHMPLFLARELARRKGCGTIVADTLARVIQRPDELTEYLALYWRGQADADKEPLSSGSKRGLARAVGKFKQETLAKYDRDAAYKLRDVIRLAHPKPTGPAQSETWKLAVKRELPSPDTWEVALSGGANKKETFERLLREDKLGGLAFLRNLRNMIAADVDGVLIRERFSGSFDRVLPFRFVSALRHAPQFVRELDKAMLRAIQDVPVLSGRTAVLVDVSGSMKDALSAKSEVTRMDVAAGLAVLVSAIGQQVRVFSFSDRLVEVPPFGGLALVGTILQSQPHSGTHLGAAIKLLAGETFDRIIVITDEQSHDQVGHPTAAHGYVINVGSYQNGVGYGKWVHIDGWSERVLDFVREVETE